MLNILLGIALLVLFGTAPVFPRTLPARLAAVGSFFLSLPVAFFLIGPLGYGNEVFLSARDGATGPAFTAFLAAAVALNVVAQGLLRRMKR